MINNFNTVCTSASIAHGMEARTEAVLNVLRDNGGRMRAKDIASALGFKWYGGVPIVQKVNHELSWLRELGLIKRIEVECEPITVTERKWVADPPKDEAPLEIVIDGVTYERKDRYFAFRNSGHWEDVPKTVTPKVAYFEIA